MSFSSKVKTELCRQTSRDAVCALAELAGLMHAGGILAFRSGKPALVFNTEHRDVVTRVFSLVKKCFGLDCELELKQGLKKADIYSLRIPAENLSSLLCSLGLGLSGPEPKTLAKLLEPAGCREAFLRGAFLGGGSMGDPSRAYHLEFVSGRSEVAEELRDLLCALGLGAGAMPRKENFIAYVKGSEDIITLLTLLGAHASVLDMENIRILKEIRNNVNRQINCESANIDKTVRSAMAQVKSIHLIEKTMGLASLSEGLLETAEVRLQNPEASLSELAALSGCSRSRINHRLRRLCEIAEQIRQKGDAPPLQD